MNPTDHRPAHTQAAHDLTALFREAKMAAHMTEMRGREALDHAYQAGKALLRAKELVPWGQWLATLEKHMPGQSRTAQCYMQIAQNWKKVKHARDIHDALAFLAHAKAEAQEKVALRGTNPQPTAHSTSPQVDSRQPQLDFDRPDDGPASTPPPSDRQKHPDTEREREKDLVAQVLRQLVRVRELLSEAYTGEGKHALDTAALRRASILTLKPDGGIVKHGESAEGITFGTRRVTNEALDLLIGMVASAKLLLANQE
jgi:hypothetical protein